MRKYVPYQPTRSDEISSDIEILRDLAYKSKSPIVRQAYLRLRLKLIWSLNNLMEV